jgi:hypothetical protein
MERRANALDSNVAINNEAIDQGAAKIEALVNANMLVPASMVAWYTNVRACR